MILFRICCLVSVPYPFVGLYFVKFYVQTQLNSMKVTMTQLGTVLFEFIAASTCPCLCTPVGPTVYLYWTGPLVQWCFPSRSISLHLTYVKDSSLSGYAMRHRCKSLLPVTSRANCLARQSYFRGHWRRPWDDRVNRVPNWALIFTLKHTEILCSGWESSLMLNALFLSVYVHM